MAFCKKCGNELESDAEFCTNCGTSVTKKTSHREVEYEGKIFKCPNCGETLKSFTSNCPTCGYELRGAESTGAVKKLADKLEQIESQRINEPKTSNFSRALFGDKPTKTDEQKISLIQSFPIPNTKEDLYEFLILSQSNIDIDLYDMSKGNVRNDDVRMVVSNAWKSKFEQAYQKSKLIFQNDARLDEIQKLYDRTYKSINKAKTKFWKTFGLVFGGIVLFYIAIFVMISLTLDDNEDINRRDRQLEYLVRQIESDLRDNKCQDAKAKAYTLTFDESLDSAKHEYWKNKQEEVHEQIKNVCGN